MEKYRVIFGDSLQDGVQVEHKDYSILFRDAEYPDQSYFTMNNSVLSRHVLLMGGAGSGKTNTFNLMLSQLRAKQGPNDVFIIFDTKGDFHKDFRMRGDYVLGNNKRFRQISERWNIFEEILADGTDYEDYSLNAREIALSLFADRGSDSQPFFVNAAKDLFTNTVIYFIRRYLKDPVKNEGILNNKTLITFLNNADAEQYRKIFSPYPDLKGALSYIGDGKSNQALGVFGELKSMLSDLFVGVFKDKAEGGGFSMRKLVQNKGGKAVFIEYDLTSGESLTPIYRMLIDLALKEALGQEDNKKLNIYLILDELKLLPKLQHLDDALNFGRSKGVKVIAGIQTINQLYDIYGETKGHVLTGGFSTLFTFHTSDNASREYVSGLYGTNVVGYQYYALDGDVEKRERDGKTVESWDQTSLQIGEAIVGLADVEVPFLFKFEEFKR